VRAPTKDVEVTEDRPARVVAEPPMVIAVLPTVTVSEVVAKDTDVPEPVPSCSLLLAYQMLPAIIVGAVFETTALISELLLRSMFVKNFLDIYLFSF
jgi:hypothetical protein